MEFPTTRPTKTLDDYMEQERQRAIIETLAWVCNVIPELPETFFDEIPAHIHQALCEELESA